MPVHPPTPGSLSEIDPVRRSVTGAAKLSIDNRFQKQRAIAVESFPVRWQLPRTQRKNRARQIAHAHPGKNEKPRVAYDQLKVAGSFFIAPTDPTIPRRHLPSWTGPQ